ncbi:MAG: hypothetical protein AMS21_09135 [Gemmatimonas sp. SG8_38_2]|nr:MAG: hypothetical protein AMS21_09135 [Gemmatimonas sp. SG8_38_2]
MTASRGDLGRIAGFALIAIVFAVIQPFVLVGLLLALLLLTYGPHYARSAIIVAVVLVVAFLGERSGLWWFERGWSLVLAGMFVWIVGLRPGWSFTAQALTAVTMAAIAVSIVVLARPGIWFDLDTLMTARASQSAQTAANLVGSGADETVQALVQRVVEFQVAVFPALLGVSSLGGLGVAVAVRSWLAGDTGKTFGRLRSFRFNDHLVWAWLLGLVLMLAPIGHVADRIGGNAVFFMGALYVLRGMAVLLSMMGGIPVAAGVVGGIVALLIYPILALLLAVMLIVGLGDTWLNVRSRLSPLDSGK